MSHDAEVAVYAPEVDYDAVGELASDQAVLRAIRGGATRWRWSSTR